MGNFLADVGTATSGFITAFVDGCKAMVDAFVITGESGAITGPSTLGIFAIAGVGLAMTGTIISFVKKLIKFR